MLNRRFLFLATVALAAYGATGCLVVTDGGIAPYESCSVGQVCRGVSTCRQANAAFAGQSPGYLCTDSCIPGGTCPADPGGNQTYCVQVSGVGRCYRACGAGNSCPAGQACGDPGGSGVMVCIPGTAASACGAAGQACCTGNTCSAGLACNGTTCVAPPNAYEGCTAASINAACANGTTCQRPMVANAGPNGFCTRACSGLQSECPAVTGATYNCYVLQGATGGQCYVDCPSGSGCPTGTTCLMTNTMTASGVRICMPPAT